VFEVVEGKKGVKISDLAGFWKMSDKEAEEIEASIDVAWKKYHFTGCLAKTRKVGNSLVVTLSKEIVESKKIKEGEIIQISVKKVRKKGFGTLKGVGSFTVADELGTHD
jgi:hypothetical protein